MELWLFIIVHCTYLHMLQDEFLSAEESVWNLLLFGNVSGQFVKVTMFPIHIASLGLVGIRVAVMSQLATQIRLFGCSRHCRRDP